MPIDFEKDIVHIEITDNSVTVRFLSEWDALYRVADTREQLKTLKDYKNTHDIIFDMTNVYVLNSLGVGFLLSQMKNSNRKLKLINVRSDILRMLQSLRISSFFEINEV